MLTLFLFLLLLLIRMLFENSSIHENVTSNYIKGKFCVSVRYRTHLNVGGMGPNILGVLKKTLISKKLILKNRVFKTGNGRKTGKRTGMGKQKQERGQERERSRERERVRERETCSTRAIPGTPH
jgi:hypothetical protein